MHRAAAHLFEALMRVPLLSVAQARMLAESVVEPALAPDRLPDDLCPGIPFTDAVIRRSLPEPGPFGLRDLRCFSWVRH
jgi:NADH dehydrogenase